MYLNKLLTSLSLCPPVEEIHGQAQRCLQIAEYEEIAEEEDGQQDLVAQDLVVPDLEGHVSSSILSSHQRR